MKFKKKIDPLEINMYDIELMLVMFGEFFLNFFFNFKWYHLLQKV